MRITEIEIKNFKAFYGTYQINLRKSGKNLLVYGENGSGKTSLYFALTRIKLMKRITRIFESVSSLNPRFGQ